MNSIGEIPIDTLSSPIINLRPYPPWMSPVVKYVQVKFPKHRSKRLMKKFKKKLGAVKRIEERPIVKLGNTIYMYRKDYDTVLNYYLTKE